MKELEKYIDIKDFLELDNPFLIGAFLSRTKSVMIDNKKYFVTYSAFKKSSLTTANINEYINNYVENLKNLSNSINWILTTNTDTLKIVEYYILNSLDLTIDQFYSELESKIYLSNWLDSNVNNESKNNFVRGFFEPRGSIDLSANYLTQDYFYKDEKQLKRIISIANWVGIDYGYLNINFRDLQPQYVSGINQRNTQLRINLQYYLKEYGIINEYKAKITESKHFFNNINKTNGIIHYDIDLPRYNKSNFSNFFNFFINNVYEKSLNEDEIKKLRIQTGFDNDVKEKRDISIIKLFRDATEDKCQYCKTTKTFLTPNKRQYFEIHHVIAFHNGKMYDDINNLVKLCPTCHTMFKKGCADIAIQEYAVFVLLKENEKIYNFCSSILQIDDKKELANKIIEMLG